METWELCKARPTNTTHDRVSDWVGMPQAECKWTHIQSVRLPGPRCYLQRYRNAVHKQFLCRGGSACRKKNVLSDPQRIRLRSAQPVAPGEQPSHDLVAQARSGRISDAGMAEALSDQETDAIRHVSPWNPIVGCANLDCPAVRRKFAFRS